MGGKIIGEKFKQYVIDEIKQRQIAHGSGVTTDRTLEQLQYLNSKTAFVRMASGVYIEEARNTKEGFRDGNKNMALAKHYILSGGTSRYSSTKDTTNPLEQRSTGGTPTQIDSGAYNVHPQSTTSAWKSQLKLTTLANIPS